MPMSYTIDAITSSAELEQDAEWWHIYHTSFPAAEIEPKQAIFNCLNQAAGISLRIRNDLGITIGIAHGQYLKGINAFMLIYMAMGADFRRQGLGTNLLEHIEGVAAQYYGSRSHLGLVFEVDRPHCFVQPEERLRAEKRILFYQTLGYEIITIDYHQPPLLAGQPPVPMHLMSKTPLLTDQEKINLVQAIYFEKYAEAYGISAVSQQTIHDLWQKIKQLNRWM